MYTRMSGIALPTTVFIGGVFLIMIAMFSQVVMTPYYRVFCPDKGSCNPRDVELAIAERVVIAMLSAAIINTLCAYGLTPIAWAVVAAVFAALIYSMKIHAIM